MKIEQGGGPCIYPGVYQHYKGALYIVLGVARFHDGSAPLEVIYIPVMPHGDDDAPVLNRRPIDGPDGFLTEVEVEGSLDITSHNSPKPESLPVFMKQPRFVFLHSFNLKRSV